MKKFDLFIVNNKTLIMTFEMKELMNKKEVSFKIDLNHLNIFYKGNIFHSIPIDYNLFFKLSNTSTIEVLEVDNSGNKISNYNIKKAS